MKFRHICGTPAMLFVIPGLASICPAADANRADAQRPTIFVANYQHITAYPAGSHGDVSPIAIDSDMSSPRGLARDSIGRLYVANSATNTVTVYAAGANGNVPPLAVIGGPETRLTPPAGIALDASDNIYVLNYYELNYASSPAITVYGPLANNATGFLDTAPLAVIAGSRTLLRTPLAIAADLNRNIYVADGSGGPLVRYAPDGIGRILIYAAGSNGNVAPSATISGFRSGIVVPDGVAVDSDGDIYVANEATLQGRKLSYQSGSVTIYAPGSKGDAAPAATIAGAGTELVEPEAITLDSSRNIYVSSYVNNVGLAVNLYAAGSNGNAAPLATIGGSNTGLGYPAALAVDSDDNIYSLNSDLGPLHTDGINVYPSGSSGDVAPSVTITSNFTGLGASSGIAVDNSGKIYVPDINGGDAGLGSVSIYPAGSYGIGPPLATITGSDTQLSYPSAIGLDPSGEIAVLKIISSISTHRAAWVTQHQTEPSRSIPSGTTSPPQSRSITGAGSTSQIRSTVK